MGLKQQMRSVGAGSGSVAEVTMTENRQHNQKIKKVAGSPEMETEQKKSDKKPGRGRK